MMLLFLSLLSCQTSNSSQNSRSLNTNSDMTAQEIFSLTWAEDALEIEITNDQGGSWWFGMAEIPDLSNTGRDSLWTGEDCYQGKTLQEGEEVQWCHPIFAIGSELLYGGDPYQLLTGEETAMEPKGNERALMYYFLNALTGDCFIGGEGLEEYANLCDNIVFMSIQ